MSPEEHAAIKARDAEVDASPLWRGWEDQHPTIAQLVRDRRLLLGAIDQTPTERLAERLFEALTSGGLWPVYDPSKPNRYRGGPFDMDAREYADRLAHWIAQDGG